MATTPAVCEHLHLPLQAGSDRMLVAMHRGYTADRYLERLAAARAAIPDLAVTTDLIVGFPGETEDDFERTLEVVAERYDSAYTFIFFGPARHRGCGDARSIRARGRLRGTVRDRLRVVVERSALARHSERVGHVEEVVVEGPERPRSRRDHEPHAPEQACPLRRRHRDPPRHLRGRPSDGRRADITARRAGRGPRACSPSHPPRGGRGLSAASASPLLAAPVLAIVGPTATGKSGLALSIARLLGGVEIVSADSMQVYRGMDIGTAKPSFADRSEVTHHLIDVAEPSEAYTVVRFQHEYEAAVAAIDAHAHRALLVGGTEPYTCAAVTRSSRPPGEWPAIRADLDAQPTSGCCTTSSPSWTRSPRRA